MRNLVTFFLAGIFLVLVGNDAQSGGREVIYAFDKDYPPHTYMKSGKPAGFDIDLLKAVLKDTGVSILYRPMQWGDVQEGLKKGEVDITSGMAKTGERMKLYNFADSPISDFRMSLFTGSVTRGKTLKDFSHRMIATQRGSLYHKILEEKGFRSALYDSEADALLALSKGKADAFVGSQKTAFFNIKEHGLKGIVPISTPIMVSSVYYALKRGDPELLSMINRGLYRVKGDGTYEKIYRKWFVEELTEGEVGRMLEKAKEASHYAYAPYSRFCVGAAVLTVSGRIYTGCNVENALLGYSTSALKVAVYKAISEGETHFKALLNLFPGDKIGAPAPDERQIIYEFGMGTLVVLDEGWGSYKTVMISELLPYAFNVSAGYTGLPTD